jgi:cellulose biosynthesis protein BcsQ
VRPDVSHLAESLSLDGFRYHELREGHRVEPVIAEWQAAWAQAGGDPLRDLAGPAPRRRPRGRAVAFLSPVPGAGRTTLAAAVSSALSLGGATVIALDADPADRLAAALGAPGGGPGLADAAQGDALRPRPARGGAGVVPFGGPRAGDVNEVEARLAGAPLWLDDEVSSLLTRVDLVVLDTAAAPSPWRAQALAAADEAIMVLRPGDDVPAQILAARGMVDEAGPRRRPSVRWVLNAFDATWPAHRRSVGALRALLGERLLPLVHEDPVVVRAAGGDLLEVAPESQAVADVQALANALAAEAVEGRRRA